MRICIRVQLRQIAPEQGLEEESYWNRPITSITNERKQSPRP